MPIYSSELIRQISEANDIVDIVSKYVPLKQKGRIYSACCPFHSEKTPSFTVNREKQLYHCFGCGAGGDLYKFLMEKENISFVDAVKMLAEKAGIELPSEDNYNSKFEKEQSEKRNELYEIHKLAAKFFFNNIRNNRKALLYLKDRGIDSKTIKKFGLGYAPDSWTALYDFLKRKGYKDERLLESGLVLKGKNNKPYDRFRNRVIIPIFNTMGKVIAFGARKMSDEDNGPKYLNSPETPIFNKGEQLFNLNHAKGELRNNPLIIVEGYMDVIALEKFGFRNSAAALGTAFTPKHSKLISRYTKDIILCFDGDSAGEKATFKAIDILNNSDLNIRVLRLPVEHDPDSFIREKGTEAFQNEIEKSIPVIDFKLKILERDNDFTTSQGILNYIEESCKVLKDLSEVQQEFYINIVSGKTGINSEAIKHQIQNSTNNEAVPVTNVPYQHKGQNTNVTQIHRKKRIPKELVDAQKIFLSHAYKNPDILDSMHITESKMTRGFFKWFYQQLDNLRIESPSLELFEDKPDFKKMAAKMLFENDYQNLGSLEHLEQAVTAIEKYANKAEISKLEQRLKNAEGEEQKKLFEQILELKKVGWV